MTAPPWHETSAGNGRGRREEGTNDARAVPSLDRTRHPAQRLPQLSGSLYPVKAYWPVEAFELVIAHIDEAEVCR
jgi:hypothetical protein